MWQSENLGSLGKLLFLRTIFNYFQEINCWHKSYHILTIFFPNAFLQFLLLIKTKIKVYFGESSISLHKKKKKIFIAALQVSSPTCKKLVSYHSTETMSNMLNRLRNQKFFQDWNKGEDTEETVAPKLERQMGEY